jgi:phage terminase small subunit
MTHKKTQPPAHLSAKTRRWFASVCNEFELEEHHLRLLELACESWDRCQAARAVIDMEGMIYEDRFGAPRSRPEIAIERDSRLSFSRLLRELDLDVAPPVDASRPPALRSIRS